MGAGATMSVQQQSTAGAVDRLSVLQRFSVAINRRFGRKRIRAFALGSVPFIVLLGAWMVNDFYELIEPWAFPSMSMVVNAFIQLQKGCPDILAVLNTDRACGMTNHIIASISRMGLAALIGLPVGIGFGILAGMNRTISKVLEPIAIFANSISGIAWIPLAIVWFGVGWVTTLFIILNTVIWLMFFNTMLGVRSIARVYEQSVETMGGNRWDIIRDVYLPGAMPAIMTGLRMSMGFGWRALIAAEMIGGDSGLGFMIFQAAAEFRIEQVFLGVILISMIWMATDRFLFGPLEKWTVERWGLVWKPS